MIGEVRASLSDCRRCFDIAESYDAMPDCDKCPRKKVVEILQINNSFWGPTAICKTKEGHLMSVDIGRVNVIGGEDKEWMQKNLKQWS